MTELQIRTLLMTFFLCFYSEPVETGLQEPHELFSLWRTQQGEWATLRSPRTCDHFSIGGNDHRVAQVLRHCKNRRHRLWILNSGPEHLKQLRAFARHQEICVAHDVLTRERSRLPTQVKICDDNDPPAISIRLPFSPLKNLYPKRAVWIKNSGILILGDATPQMQAEFKNKLGAPIKILVLAHHGMHPHKSLTALSAAASDLNRFGQSRVSQKNQDSLTRRKIPIIKTTDWGNLHFELK